MFCENCGTQVSENTKFCPKCGTQIIQEENWKNKESIKKNKYIGIFIILIVVVVGFSFWLNVSGIMVL